jgi:ribonuclease III
MSEGSTTPHGSLEALQERLGHRFKDGAMLMRALVHRSYANERPETGGDNERLEFLGDAVLDLVVADWLFHELPDAGEGRLTSTKASMVKETTLARLARKLDLGEHLLLGRGETQAGGRRKPSILADTVEAIVAAIYLDAGIDEADRCIRAWLSELHPDVGPVVEAGPDPRSRLQEIAHRRFGRTPAYAIEGVSGPDHDASFRARVELPGVEPAYGEGKSKKDAKRAAAEEMLGQIGDEEAEE